MDRKGEYKIRIVFGIVLHFKFGEGPDRDERTMKLSAFALAYTWLVTFVLSGQIDSIHGSYFCDGYDNLGSDTFHVLFL